MNDRCHRSFALVPRVQLERSQAIQDPRRLQRGSRALEGGSLAKARTELDPLLRVRAVSPQTPAQRVFTKDGRGFLSPREEVFGGVDRDAVDGEAEAVFKAFSGVHQWLLLPRIVKDGRPRRILDGAVLHQRPIASPTGGARSALNEGVRRVEA